MENKIEYKANKNISIIDESILESIILKGDISGLNTKQKIQYYKMYCERLGLDPATQPFKILNLKGKEVLYCDRSGVQQLSNKEKVSHEIKDRENINNEIYNVYARASLPDGRFTESIGSVSIAGLKGNDLANALMKAETKAKRRATLDLLGLGILDETEIETIEGAKKIPMTIELSEKEIKEKLEKCQTIQEQIDLWNKLTEEQKEIYKFDFSDKKILIETKDKSSIKKDKTDILSTLISNLTKENFETEKNKIELLINKVKDNLTKNIYANMYYEKLKSFGITDNNFTNVD